jgi:hypothetical protein
VELGFVESTMQLWNGADFHCQQYAETGSTDMTIAQCWGPNCQQDSDCPQTPAAQVCQLPYPAPTACPVCADGSCYCLWGQCVPAATYVAGASM